MRKLILQYLFLLTAAALITTVSCKKDQTMEPIPEQCPDTISFASVVEPIIEQNCSTSGCHDSGAAGGYNLIGYGNISGNASAILNTIKHNSGVTAMPYFQAKLADSLIEQLDCWNAQGKLNN